MLLAPAHIQLCCLSFPGTPLDSTAGQCCMQPTQQKWQRRPSTVLCCSALCCAMLCGVVLSMRLPLPWRACWTPAPANCCCFRRLLSALAALCGIIAASVAEENLSGSSSPSQPEPELGLQLTPEEQQDQEAWEMEEEAQQEEAEEAEEQAGRHLRRRHHGLFQARQTAAEAEAAAAGADAAGATFPALGPISGRLMQALCVELLTAIRMAAQLCVPGALGGRNGEEWRQLASMLAGDVALQLELRCQLDVAAAEAAALLRRYPPFEAMCEEVGEEWLGAQLAAAGRQLGGEGSSRADAETGPPGLALFLSTLADVSLG